MLPGSTLSFPFCDPAAADNKVLFVCNVAHVGAGEFRVCVGGRLWILRFFVT